MISPFVAWMRGFVHALLTSAAPGQLAAGFTLGMLIGVVPKTNLIALSLCVALFSLRCDNRLGLAAALVFSFVGQFTDPFAHKLGATVLNADSLQGVYSAAFSSPLGPWWGFNNTVVTGSLLLGLYIAYPVYFATRVLFTAVQSGVAHSSYEWNGTDADVEARAVG